MDVSCAFFPYRAGNNWYIAVFSERVTLGAELNDLSSREAPDFFDLLKAIDKHRGTETTHDTYTLLTLSFMFSLFNIIIIERKP